MPYKKPVRYISGLVAGFLLFIALLAVQLNSVIFNAGFQQAAIDRLNIYERLVAAPVMFSAKSGDIPFEAAVKNSITPDLLNKNVKSLIDGLIDFVSGRSRNLPDLYISGADKLSIATSAGVTPAAVEKINLQLIMMFSSEQNFNDILSVVSLIQFILAYLPPFSLLLCAAVAAAASVKRPSEIPGWMRTSVLTFFILCWLSAWLIDSIPWLIPFERFSWLPGSDVTGILFDYIHYCSGGISAGILLSGLLLPAGIWFAFYLCNRLNERNETVSLITSSSHRNRGGLRHKSGLMPDQGSSMPVLDRSMPVWGSSSAAKASSLPVRINTTSTKACTIPGRGSSTPVRTHFIPVRTRFTSARNRTIPLLLAVTAIYSLLAYALVSNTDSLFHKRNLAHAVSYIMGNLSYNRYTDARNEDVCLLNVKVVSENDKTPVQNMPMVMYPLDSSSAGKASGDKRVALQKTDENGSGSFLLSKGEFRLELYSSDSSGYDYQAVPAPLSYNLSLSSPGRTDLTVTLGSAAGTAGNDGSVSNTGTAVNPGSSTTASESSKASDSDKSGNANNPTDSGKSNNANNSTGTGNSTVAGSSSDPGVTSVPVIPRLKIVDASMQYMP